MPVFTVPIHELREFNPCHAPSGSAAGGQFCSDDVPVTVADDVGHAEAREVLGPGATLGQLKAIAQTFAGPETPWIGVEIEQDRDVTDGDGVKFTFGGEGAIGYTSLVRTESGFRRAELGLIWIEESKRKHGLSRPILRAMVAGWEQAGISHVELDAVQLGAYAWLRYGFTPKMPEGSGVDARRARGFTRYARERLESLKNLSPETRQYITKALDDVDAGDAKAAWRISDLRDGKRNIGFEMLQELAWRGELNLNDPAQRARFDHYLKG